MSPPVSVHNRFRAQGYMSQECCVFVRSVELIHHQIGERSVYFIASSPTTRIAFKLQLEDGSLLSA